MQIVYWTNITKHTTSAMLVLSKVYSLTYDVLKTNFLGWYSTYI